MAAPVSAGRAKPKREGRSLGDDRPSFCARLSVGLSKPWGVWEGASIERPGEPPAGYVKLGTAGARLGGVT